MFFVAAAAAAAAPISPLQLTNSSPKAMPVCVMVKVDTDNAVYNTSSSEINL